MELIGREEEKRLLKEYLKSEKSEFIAIYGRRRVGKTFFIRKMVGEKACFSMTGMENAGLREQLANFFFTLRRNYPEAKQPKSWLEAFDELITFLEKQPRGNKIVVIDELPWMDTVRSGFVGALEHFWNGWASQRDDVKLIVCGSSTSWMIDNIINNRGGLHNRKTHQIYIAPFTLKESEAYFKTNGFGYRRKEIAECYMVMGGVAYYYSLMSPQKSVAQNIDQLLFAPNGELGNEFDNVYHSLFKKAGNHITIVTAMARKAKGLTRKEIIEQAKQNNNQALTRTLEELEKCGFIRSYIPFGMKKRETLYQLTDAFTLFHFHFAKENKYQDPEFWTHSINSPRFHSWSGYAFEILCLNHITQIKKALGISGVQSNVGCWTERGDDAKRGAQIDLLIDRADQTVNVCEMKYSRSEYETTKKDCEDWEQKIAIFAKETKTRKSILLTLVTSFGLAKNKYASIAQSQVTLDDLFEG